MGDIREPQYKKVSGADFDLTDGLRRVRSTGSRGRIDLGSIFLERLALELSGTNGIGTFPTIVLSAEFW